MLNATVSSEVASSWSDAAHNEIALSDSEIMARVDRIRSGWSVAERVARRREAERRFAQLIEALSDTTAA